MIAPCSGSGNEPQVSQTQYRGLVLSSYPRHSIYSRPVKVTLREAVQRIRGIGRVPLGVLSYDPRTDTLHVQLFEDIQDIGEANAILIKFNLAVVDNDK